MTPFLEHFADSIHGVWSGFERIRFRGTRRWLAHVRGLAAYWAFVGVRRTEFKPYGTGVTDGIRPAVEAEAERAGVAIE